MISKYPLPRQVPLSENRHPWSSITYWKVSGCNNWATKIRWVFFLSVSNGLRKNGVGGIQLQQKIYTGSQTETHGYQRFFQGALAVVDTQKIYSPLFVLA